MAFKYTTVRERARSQEVAGNILRVCCVRCVSVRQEITRSRTMKSWSFDASSLAGSRRISDNKPPHRARVSIGYHLAILGGKAMTACAREKEEWLGGEVLERQFKQWIAPLRTSHLSGCSSADLRPNKRVLTKPHERCPDAMLTRQQLRDKALPRATSCGVLTGSTGPRLARRRRGSHTDARVRGN